MKLVLLCLFFTYVVLALGAATTENDSSDKVEKMAHEMSPLEVFDRAIVQSMEDSAPEDIDLSPVDHSVCVQSYRCAYCGPGKYKGKKCYKYLYYWKHYDWCYGKKYCLCKRCLHYYKHPPFYKHPPIYKKPYYYPYYYPYYHPYYKPHYKPIHKPYKVHKPKRGH